MELNAEKISQQISLAVKKITSLKEKLYEKEELLKQKASENDDLRLENMELTENLEKLQSEKQRITENNKTVVNNIDAQLLELNSLLDSDKDVVSITIERNGAKEEEVEENKTTTNNEDAYKDLENLNSLLNEDNE